MSSEKLKVAFERINKFLEEQDRSTRQLEKNLGRLKAQDEPIETVTLARAAFILALQEEAPLCFSKPHAFVDSHEAVLLLIAQERWETVAQTHAPSPISDFLSDLSEWAITHNLSNTRDDWVLRDAFGLLQAWSHIGSVWKPLPTYLPTPSTTMNLDSVWDPPRFSFEDVWDPRRDTKKNFEKRVHIRFKKALRSYFLQIALEPSSYRNAVRYEPQGLEDSIPLNAKRLVRYQVLEESYVQIALDSIGHPEEKDVSPQAVGNGVKRFAALIGVPLRSGSQGGRPRKQ